MLQTHSSTARQACCYPELCRWHRQGHSKKCLGAHSPHAQRTCLQGFCLQGCCQPLQRAACTPAGRHYKRMYPNPKGLQAQQHLRALCIKQIPQPTHQVGRGHRKVKTLPCAYIHWQGDASKAALHTHWLRASPRKAEKAFISSVSLSSQRFYPFSEMCSSQSRIVAFTLQEDAIGTDLSVYRLESLGQTSVPANTSAG